MGGMIQEQLTTTVQDTVASLVMWTPRVLGAVLLLLLALVVAKIVERTLRSVLTRLRVGALMQRGVSTTP